VLGVPPRILFHPVIVAALRTVSALTDIVAELGKQPIAAGRREATVFGSSVVIDVVIADP
jgi:hypothetical protein